MSAARPGDEGYVTRRKICARGNHLFAMKAGPTIAARGCDHDESVRMLYRRVATFRQADRAYA